MNGPVFVDTNILLYAIDVTEETKHQTARMWRDQLRESRQGRLSFQVLQEFYANVERKWPQAKASARAEVKDLLAWQPIVVNDEILKSSWKLQDRYGISFWDALIAAAAKAPLQISSQRRLSDGPEPEWRSRCESFQKLSAGPHLV
jgi:predicted nucleic acid-binding protein